MCKNELYRKKAEINLIPILSHTVLFKILTKEKCQEKAK